MRELQTLVIALAVVLVAGFAAAGPAGAQETPEDCDEPTASGEQYGEPCEGEIGIRSIRDAVDDAVDDAEEKDADGATTFGQAVEAARASGADEETAVAVAQEAVSGEAAPGEAGSDDAARGEAGSDEAATDGGDPDGAPSGGGPSGNEEPAGDEERDGGEIVELPETGGALLLVAGALVAGAGLVLRRALR
ncbi:MAG: hypothetical protein H0V53_12075 [Rubrobacter sp.]|nr:hypothetical protein [Rubrobacter sp.]